jgi:hypothetical protein
MNATSTPEAALYCQGTFSTANPTPAQMAQMIDAAKDIGNSGFTTVILGQFHVHTDGGIYDNDSPLDTVMSALQTIPSLLKQAGKVQKVLVTFGPFASDFSGIQANLASFQATMANLMSSCGIDGLDWDLEQNLDCGDSSSRRRTAPTLGVCDPRQAKFLHPSAEVHATWHRAAMRNPARRDRYPRECERPGDMVSLLEGDDEGGGAGEDCARGRVAVRRDRGRLRWAAPTAGPVPDLPGRRPERSRDGCRLRRRVYPVYTAAALPHRSGLHIRTVHFGDVRGADLHGRHRQRDRARGRLRRIVRRRLRQVLRDFTAVHDRLQDPGGRAAHASSMSAPRRR